MDRLQKQIIDLNNKVDQIHEIVERLSYQVTALSEERQQQVENNTNQFSTGSPMTYQSSFSNGRFQSAMEHKDILVDGKNGYNQNQTSSEQTLSPEIQIRRLTAQLTAAYNRIAALEEQLLASRIH